MVFSVSDDSHVIDLCDSEEEFKKLTVEELRLKVAHKEEFRLTFDSKIPEDNCLLWKCGVQHMSTIDATLFLKGGGLPDQRDGGMGDKKDKNQRMETLASF